MEWPMQVHPKDLPKSADVVVIGSGFTGLSAARSLAKTGTQVIVLEKDEIGAGASSQNGGIVHPTLGVSGQELIDRYGVERAKDLYRVFIDGMKFQERLIEEEQIDCHFNLGGAFEAAAKPQHLDWMQERVELLSEVFDHHTNVIPAADQSKFIGSALYHGGWQDPLGATLHPARLVVGLGESALKAGAELHPNTPVVDIETDGSMHLVKTPRGSVRAGSVILANNGYTDDLVPADELEEETRATAVKLSLVPPEVMRLTKQPINRAFEIMGLFEALKTNIV